MNDTVTSRAKQSIILSVLFSNYKLKCSKHENFLTCFNINFTNIYLKILFLTK